MEIKNILFINPFLFKQNLLSDQILIGPLYIENFLKSKIGSLKTDIIDFRPEGKLGNFDINQIDPIEKFHIQMDKLISSLDFDLMQNSIIGISCPTSKHYIPLIMIAKYLQLNYPNTPIMVGGAHVSSVPIDFIFPETPIDYIIIGEGELTFYDLVKNEPNKHETPQIFKNNPIENIESLPPINFDIFKKYAKAYANVSVYLSRGCPFNCSFCMESKLIEAGNIHVKWRSHSPKRAMSEIKIMLEFGEVNNVSTYGFYDPIFGFSRKWLIEFLELYPKNPDFNIWTEMRCDVLNEEVLKMLHERRIGLMYGLETYSKEMLLIMKKTPNPSQFLSKFDEIIKTSEELDMLSIINIIINHPGETKETFNDTFEFSKKMTEKIGFTTLNYVLYRNFPGTPIYLNLEQYKERYGSDFYVLDWWKSRELLDFGQFAVRASRDLPFRELLNLYLNSYTEVQEQSLESIKRHKKEIKDFFGKILNEKGKLELLRREYEELNNFLDNQGIEIESHN